MNEFKTDKAVYTPADFVLWQNGGILEITPKFQRRPVWTTPIRSFFIDTLLRGMTIPPIYLRITQNPARTKAIREVVDGQQRVRTVLEFIKDDGFRLSKTLSAPWAGKRFADLSADQKTQIMDSGFPSEIFKGISDQQVLEVFCRLNMNGVPLNKQELRNGTFFGPFKQSCYRLAHSYLEFWRTHKIFTEQSIARMLEVELTSELLIAGHSGMQDKKVSINDFYKELDNEYPDQGRDEKRFREVFAAISETFSAGDLAESVFRRPPFFYTLYCVVYHHMYGLPKVPRPSPKKQLTADDRESLLTAVLHLSEIIRQSKDAAAEVPKKYNAFVAASARQTDNIKPREIRFNTLFEAAF